MMTRSQAEMLLLLAQNTSQDSVDLIEERNRLFTAHAQRLLNDEQMLIKALDLNRRDQERFANWIPQQPTLRQAIQQGPRPAIAQQGGQGNGQEATPPQRHERQSGATGQRS